VAIIVGAFLVVATVTGVAKSVSDHGHHSTGAPSAQVTLYGSR
jgi:hypothetical protein